MKSISIALAYCSNDYCFLKSCIDHVLPFAQEVVVVSCDHYWNGETENHELLNKGAAENPGATFITFEYDPTKDTMWHNVMTRRIACQAFEKPADYILFLDADEIIETANLIEWWKTRQSDPLDVYKFANYWYFRDFCFQSTKWEDSVVLVKNDPSCINEHTFDSSQHGDRNAFYDKNPTPRKARMVTFNGKPFIHHYSWVRTHQAMLQKVRSWGHNANQDWVSLVNKEFSAPWRGYDLIFPERQLKYNTVEPYVTIDIG